ncbi:MAG: hypothetical protein COB76_00815 [Alphaproteobacteria bacterium]|nr:MAG: hypothetical protein COB76_00815 [Alphaproteobacteria bacterium]
MSEHTNPQFSDVLSLLDNLPTMPKKAPFETTGEDTLTHLSQWLGYYSRVYDFSKGFEVNRCALYWAGYDESDAFDGKKFVDSCKDGKSSLRSLASILDTDLQIFELAPNEFDRPNSSEIAMACSYGMMAIEDSTQLFCVASFGQGVETAAQKAFDALNAAEFFDIEDFMTAHCGLDHAAILGNAVAAIMKGVPILIEGVQGRLIKTLLFKYTGESFGNIILTKDFPMPISQNVPGKMALATAITLKTLFLAMKK